MSNDKTVGVKKTIINESKVAFENRINSRLVKAKRFRGVLFKSKKGDGFLGKCKNGKFEVYMPVTMGASEYANKYGSCIHGHYYETAQGLVIDYRFGRTIVAKIDTCLITIMLISGLIFSYFKVPELIPVLVIAYIVYMALFFHVPNDDKTELLNFIKIT